MCGIFALFNQISSTNSIQIDDITKEFMKGKGRGPEFSVLDNVSIDALFGFHRLAINGLNNQSNQPIKIGDLTLICNGEIYNYKQLYNFLNITPTTGSDCEIILHLYKIYGIEYTLQIIDGVFSFILLDNNPENTCAYAARDPYGVRPLYIMHNNTNRCIFAFASEMKMLQKIKETHGDEYIIDHFQPGTFIELTYPKKVLSKWTKINSEKYICQSVSAFNIRNDSISVDKTFKTIMYGIRNLLHNSVYKRCLNTERPFACLLSGGLDSSLIASIVCRYRRSHNMTPVETYCIGLEGSDDIKYAKETASYLKTIHTSIIKTEKEFLDAIPEVIYAIESYDTTTVRASIGNYLISKYISENSSAKVIFNGDGSDELTGGYLYMNYAKNCIEFDKECRRLLTNIHKYDVLRSDKSISSNGLEPRTPFLDKSFVQFYLSIPPNIRFRKQIEYNKYISTYNNIEKYLLRMAFSKELTDINYLPESILWRTKEAFSDGVSTYKNSLFEIIQAFVETLYTDEDLQNAQKKYTHNSPETKEQLYYRDIFESHFKGQSHIIPEFWMPKFIKANDPSARTLDVYIDNHYELQERSL